MKRKLPYSLAAIVGALLLVLIGAVLLHNRKYQLISLLIAFISCLPFFLAFESKNNSAARLVLIAVMVALSVLGRVLFAPIPGFKPVTAITIITAVSFGPQAGFLTGALSAVLSNMFFGQGPWTPLQMFVWGLIGFFAGAAQKRGWLQSKITLAVYGALSGVAFSLMMDVWTVLAIDGRWNWARYLAAVATAVPFTIALLNLQCDLSASTYTAPYEKILSRIKVKYGLDRPEEDPS